MLCARCGDQMDAAEAREYAGENLCEDCYMDVLNPPKSCDPWAVYTASRLDTQELNQAQEKIMGLIRQKKRVNLGELSQASGLEGEALAREIAALRHMELLRGEPSDDGQRWFRAYADRN